ncbi:uncharacterized protein LOC143281672 [Babylonia areolata]|uniref:uncharacterized protein LOC143281672 n=1 Tax=Babylonia areolata TaxID=304850 RepID=UPI003FD0445C
MDGQSFVVSSSQITDGGLFDWNLPSNYCAFLQDMDRDDDLAKAEKQAMESGTITPLVKQELKLLIQSRRLSQGKEELKVGFKEPCQHKLTPEEEERRQRRKDQNRRAAKRFRQNKKVRESTLMEEIGMLEGKNDGLREKVTELQRVKDRLLKHIYRHLVSCPSSPPALLHPSTLPSSHLTAFTYSPPPPPSDGSASPSSSTSSFSSCVSELQSAGVSPVTDYLSSDDALSPHPGLVSLVTTSSVPGLAETPLC